MSSRNKIRYIAVIIGTMVLVGVMVLATSLKKKSSRDVGGTENSGTDAEWDSDESSTETEKEAGESESDSSETASESVTGESEIESRSEETKSEPESTTSAPTTTSPVDNGIIGQNPTVNPGNVKNMVTLGLNYVSRSFGYSLYDREGKNGHFDCSGFVSVLLRDGLGETQVGWFSDGPWDTAYWRYWATLQPVGSTVKLGGATYRVAMKDSYDFANAWAVPGSIVIQYPPENDPSVKMGHASIALGKIPYNTTADVIDYLNATYGVNLSGTAGGPNGIPMVYDQYGSGAGHISWKINANGVAEATCVDNNYASRPEWVEKISIVLVPVE